VSYSYAETIYQYTDSNGVTVFTNNPPKNIKDKKVYIKTPQTYSFSSSKSDSAASSTNYNNNYAPNNQVTNSKKQILQEELANEQTALNDASQALAEGKEVRLGSEKNYQKYQDRIQALQNAVTEHEKNIQLLQQQIQK